MKGIIAEVLSAKTIYHRGQNQDAEEEFARSMLSATVSVSTNESVKAAIGILNSFSNTFDSKSTHFSSAKSDWEDMFPCLLPFGNRRRNGLLHSTSVREWVKYVLEIPSISFKKDINFIFYANAIIRSPKITGFASCKPIHNGSG